MVSFKHQPGCLRLEGRAIVLSLGGNVSWAGALEHRKKPTEGFPFLCLLMDQDTNEHPEVLASMELSAVTWQVMNTCPNAPVTHALKLFYVMGVF